MNLADHLITLTLNEGELGPEALNSLFRIARESEHKGERDAALAALARKGYKTQDIIGRVAGGSQPEAPKPARQKRSKQSGGRPEGRPTKTNFGSEGGSYKHTNTWSKPSADAETIRRNRSAFDARMKASEAKFGRK